MTNQQAQDLTDQLDAALLIEYVAHTGTPPLAAIRACIGATLAANITAYQGQPGTPAAALETLLAAATALTDPTTAPMEALL